MKKLMQLAGVLLLAVVLWGQTTVVVTGNIKATSSVKLTWNASSTLGVTYKVLRGTQTGGPYSVIATGQACCIYQDITTQPQTDYYYVVRANNTNGDSTVSNEQHVKMP